MTQNEALNFFGLDVKTTQEQIKKKFREFSKRYHPDITHGDDSLFKKTTEAYHSIEKYIYAEPYKQHMYASKSKDTRVDFHIILTPQEADIYDRNAYYSKLFKLPYYDINEIPEDIRLNLMIKGNIYCTNVDKGIKLPIYVILKDIGLRIHLMSS